MRDESSHSRGPEAVLERRWGGVGLGRSVGTTGIWADP